MTTVHPRHTWPTCPGAQCPTTQTWFASVTFSPTVTSWCELPVSCADVGLHTRVTRCSDFKLCLLPQVTHSAISPQVQTGPTRTVTSDLLSATLAEAATQLSFAAFLERASLYVISRRPRYPTPPHLWMPPRRLFHTSLSLRTFLRRWVLTQLPRFLLTCLFRLLYAVLYYTILPHNNRSRSSLLDVSSRTILLIVRDRHRHKAILVVPHRLNLLTLLQLAVSAVLDRDDHVRTMAPRVLLQPPPGLEQFAHLQVSLLMHLLKRHRCDPVYVHLSQSRLHSHRSVPPKWEHILCAQRLPAREVLVPPWWERTKPVDADPCAGTGPFPKPRALVLPLVHFGQSKPGRVWSH